jgi:hypothetical protein
VKPDTQSPSQSANDELNRIGLAVHSSLLDPCERLIARTHQALGDLMWDVLVEQSVSNPDTDVAGAVTLVCDHHVQQGIPPRKTTGNHSTVM